MAGVPIIGFRAVRACACACGSMCVRADSMHLWRLPGLLVLKNLS